MTSKKKKTISTMVIVMLVIGLLFIPFPRDPQDDGGSREYTAYMDKIVYWNRLCYTFNPERNEWERTKYTQKKVYWFPNSRKTLEELWRIEALENNLLW